MSNQGPVNYNIGNPYRNLNANNPWSPGYVGPQIGSTPGGAENLANQLAAYGATKQNNTAAQIQGPSATNVNQGLAGLAAQANGQTPSAAAIGMGSALGGPSLSNAYAQGRAGGALGQASAASQLAGASQQAIGQGGAGRAQEIGQAQQANAGANIQQLGTDQGLALQQAQLQQSQNALNDQSQTAYQQMAQQTLAAQPQADTGYDLANMGDAGQLGVQNIQQQALQAQQTIGGIAGIGSGVATGLANYAQQPSGPQNYGTPYGSASDNAADNASSGGGYDPNGAQGIANGG